MDQLDYRPEPCDTVDEAFVRAFLPRYQAAWNAHDAGALCDLAADDVLWEDPSIPGPPRGRARGHEAVRAWLAIFWRAFPDMEFGPLDGADAAAPPAIYFAPGGRVAVPWWGRGTMTGPLDPPGLAPTGKRVDLTGVDLYAFRGRQLCQVRTFTDLGVASAQLGLMPRPGGLAERVAALAQRAAVRLGLVR
jgi:ketosteroid isomerase-like protein